MKTDRQAVPLGGLIDRPEIAAAERHFGIGEHQHLHETLVGRAALDFFGGEVVDFASAP